jgi:hypothetical protein
MFNCWAYPPGKEVPEEFWRKIETTYPDGKVMTLIYRAEPEDPGELPALMWKIQRGAARFGFSIRITDENGTVTEAGPIR